jgi:4-amino-4-deoxy-L-arabinose transferase-like glycosyltransferase
MEGDVSSPLPPDCQDHHDAPAPAGRRRRWAEAALILSLALTLNLAGNGRFSLFDRDEPRYAACTREMRVRSDWIYPTFNGEPRYHKPVLIYWLMRAGYALGGDNPFGARLVSAAAGAATCLVVLRLGRRMLGDRAGFLAALMLTTAPIMVVESKLATTDATLTLFLVAGQACLWELSRRESLGAAAGFWVAMALAVLTKGPVGPALIASAGVASWWWGGPTVIWRRLNWRWGLVLFLLVAGPWYAAIGIQSHGDFYRFALGRQIAARVTTQMEQHGGFPGYYLVTSMVIFYPWVTLLPAANSSAWSRRRSDPRSGFLLGWVFGPMILLECVRTKLVHYYLPAYPACALLAAWLLEGIIREGVNIRRWSGGRMCLGLLGGLGLGIAAVFVAAAVVLPPALRWPCLATAAVIAAGTVWGLQWMQRAATVRAVAGLAVTWAVVMLALGGWLLPAAEPYRMARIVGRKLAVMAQRDHAEPILLSFQEPSVVYAMGRPAQMVRTWKQFYEILDSHGSVVTAIIPLEWPEFVRRRFYLDVDVRETVQGFSMTKGRTQSVRLAVIRQKPTTDPAIARAAAIDRWWADHPEVPAPSLTSPPPEWNTAPSPSDPAVRRAGGEQLDVK